MMVMISSRVPLMLLLSIDRRQSSVLVKVVMQRVVAEVGVGEAQRATGCSGDREVVAVSPELGATHVLN